MGGVVSRPKPPPPAPAPVYVAPTKAEVSQATSTDSGMERGKGRSSMILTGPQGLGSGDLKLRKKTLLG